MDETIGAAARNGDVDELHAGHAASTPWQLSGRAWWQVLKRCFVMNGFHNLSLLAAGVAFYTFLSVTPLLASTVLLYGLIGNAQTVERSMQTVIEVVPADAARLIQEQLTAAVETSSGVAGLALAVSLFLAIFGASRASKGLIGALNIINGEHESRNILKFNATALGLTLAAVFVAVVVVLVVFVLAVDAVAVGIQGTNSVYQLGTPRWADFRWPGAPGAFVTVQRQLGPLTQDFEGDWAVFRLMEAASIRPRGGTAYDVSWSFRDGPHTVTVRYEMRTTSENSPLANPSGVLRFSLPRSAN